MVRKVHAFRDCKGFYYSDPKDVLFTDNVEQVTCGACRQRILNVLLEADWSQLSLAQVALLSSLKNTVKVDS